MRILDQHYRINEAAGIGIVPQKDGTALINVCTCIIENKQLSFEKKLTNISVSELGVKVNKGIPAAVNISGRVVLYKKLERIEEVTPANFQLIFPNAVMDDFYVQHFPSGLHSFVAVIRKTEADKWLQVINDQGIKILMLTLGPFPVQHVLPQLNIYDKEIIFHGVKIERSADGGWDTVDFNETYQAPYLIKVENEQIDQSLLVPYATAFQLLLSEKLDLVKAIVPELESALAEIIRNKKFKVNAFVILIIFFVLLLGNFMWLSALRSENARLEENVTTSSQTTSDLQNIEDEIKQKELLLHELGWNGGLYKSAMIDQAAALMPAEIVIKEIAVNPVDQGAEHGFSGLKFQDGKLLIRGESAQVIPVNEWVARLRTKKWAKHVELESYNFNNELNTGVFTIILTF